MYNKNDWSDKIAKKIGKLFSHFSDLILIGTSIVIIFATWDVIPDILTSKKIPFNEWKTLKKGTEYSFSVEPYTTGMIRYQCPSRTPVTLSITNEIYGKQKLLVWMDNDGNYQSKEVEGNMVPGYGTYTVISNKDTKVLITK